MRNIKNIIHGKNVKRRAYEVFYSLRRVYKRLPIPHRLRRALHRRLIAPLFGLMGLIRKKTDTVSSYQDWIHRNEPDEETLLAQRGHLFHYTTLVSVAMPMCNTPLVFLKELLDALLAQTYGNWELCLVDGSEEKDARIEKLCASDKRIRYRFLQTSKGISGNTNEALTLASGDYIAFVDSGDTLAPFALYELVKAINERPKTAMFFSDEDRLADGQRSDPVFKPDFAPDTLRSRHYIGRLVAMKKTLLEQLGGLDGTYDGMQDYDLILRASEITADIHHIRKILYHRRQSNVHSDASKSTEKANAAGASALQAHISRLGINGAVAQDEKTPGVFHVQYDVAGTPSVSIVIPNKDHIQTLKTCVDSILERTAYAQYEIVIVENNSENESTFAYYRELERSTKVRVLRYPEKGFNYSKIINFGVRNSVSDYVIQLNNDTEVITPQWIEWMLGFAQRPDVGAVGARLLFPDRSVQHAGIYVRAGEQHPIFQHLFRSYSILNCSAVTGACIMSRRALFEQIGYMDEEFQVAFGDVDFCFKLRQKGLRVVYQHYVELFHHESATRGYDDTPKKQAIFRHELERFICKWSNDVPIIDPYIEHSLRASEEK